MSIQDYYGEVQKGLMCCGMVEELEDSIFRIYSGLRRDIQDIVDYKEFNTVNQLFQFAMIAKKELQGREQWNKTTAQSSCKPHMTASSRLPKASTFRVPPLVGKRPSVPTSSLSAAPKSPPSRPTDSGKNSFQVPTQVLQSISSMGRTSGIQQYRCHGIGHMQKDCSSAGICDDKIRWLHLHLRHRRRLDDDAANDNAGYVLGGGDTSSHMNIIFQLVLST